MSIIKKIWDNRPSAKRIAELKHTISDLERTLSRERHHNRRSALVSAAHLPPCKSLACYGCKHIVFAPDGHGALYLLGCGKELKCEDFSGANRTPEKFEALEKIAFSLYGTDILRDM